MTETAKSLEIDRNKVYRTLKKLNEPINGKTGPRKTKINVNESFFDKIDNEKVAYWLGFITADGCIRQNKSGSWELSLHLSANDKEHLVKFLEDIGSEHKINIRTINGGKLGNRQLRKSKSARVRIIRKQITDALIMHGVFPNKTKHGISIPNIPNNLLRHWTRGFVDGDGSFWRRKRNDALCFAVVCPQRHFLEKLQETFKQNCKCNGGSYSKTSKNCWRLAYEGKQAERVHKWLYQNATVFLARKQQMS